MYLVVSSIPFIVMGTLTGFQHGSTSKTQQGLILCWNIGNIVFAPVVAYLTYGAIGRELVVACEISFCMYLDFLVPFAIFFVPPLAMFIIAGLQLA